MLISHGAGQVSGAIAQIRRLTDQPQIRAKYSDSDILDLMNESYQEVLQDLYAQADQPPIGAYEVSTVTDQEYYVLPASVGEVVRIWILDSDGNKYQEIIPGSSLNPYGHGIRFEGNQRFSVSPEWATGYTIRVEYISSGDILMCVGKFDYADGSTSGLTLDPSNAQFEVTAGGVDPRPNAYVGGFVGLLGASNEFSATGDGASYVRFPIQHRIIDSYVASTGVFGVVPSWDFDISTAFDGTGPTIDFELYPIEAPAIWPVITRHTARLIAGFENRKDRFKILTQLYSEAKRATALRFANFQTRSGDSLVEKSPDWRDWYEGMS